MWSFWLILTSTSFLVSPNIFIDSGLIFILSLGTGFLTLTLSAHLVFYIKFKFIILFGYSYLDYSSISFLIFYWICSCIFFIMKSGFRLCTFFLNVPFLGLMMYSSSGSGSWILNSDSWAVYSICILTWEFSDFWLFCSSCALLSLLLTEFSYFLKNC